ncbi:MAG: hypothetical protein ICV66_01970 [Chitinophagaceae bacterium]|nr:hypothetical protein [Chitinophagaceae bacterium]
MNFKAYDILSSLVPGFLAVLFLLKAFNMQYDKDMVIAYTAIAFLLGYLMNTVSSWLEDFLFSYMVRKTIKQVTKGERYLESQILS